MSKKSPRKVRGGDFNYANLKSFTTVHTPKKPQLKTEEPLLNVEPETETKGSPWTRGNSPDSNKSLNSILDKDKDKAELPNDRI